MSQAAIDIPEKSTESVDKIVEHRCVELLFSTTFSAAAGSLLVSALCAWIVWTPGIQSILSLWLALIVSTVAVRLLLGLRFRKQRFEQLDSAGWLKRFNRTVYASAVIWAFGAWSLYPREDVSAQALMLVLFAGVSSVAVQTLTWSRNAMFATIAAPLSMLAVRITMGFDQTHLIMAVMIVVFGVLVLRLANASHQTQMGLLRLQAENGALVANLKGVMKHTEKLNRELFQEVEDKERVARELEVSSAAKSQFLSSMSHELRTPLNAILGFAQIMQMEQSSKDTEQNKYLEEILRAGDHLLLLINDVLDLSKIESGKANVQMQPVEVSGTLARAVALIEPVADQQGISIAVEQVEDGLSVQADPTKLTQVIINLLNNAVKYNHAAGKVHITTAVRDNKVVRISIRDTGPGIGDELMANLFKPFERGQAGHSTIQGTGIGLTISKELMELMDGRIGVESTPGEGSEFWLELAISASVTS